MADLADVMRALQALQAGQRALALEVAALRADALRAPPAPPAAPRAPPSPEDRTVMLALLPLIAGHSMAPMFETHELLALAEVEPPVARALRPVLAVGGDAGKRLGRMLKRCAGEAFAGCRLHLLRERAPLLFKLDLVSNPPETR